MEDANFTLELSEANYERWVTPREAVRRLAPHHPSVIKEVIQGRVLAGDLRLGFQRITELKGERRSWSYGVLVPRQWLSVEDGRFWASGDFDPTLDEPGPDGIHLTINDEVRIGRSRAYAVRGARFDPIGFAELEVQMGAESSHANAAVSFRPAPVADALGPHAAGLLTAPFENLPLVDKPPNRGGRPSAEFWIDMSLEIARRMHMGDFKPKNQAEVVDAMERWLIDHHCDGGLTKTKECARKVFNLFKD